MKYLLDTNTCIELLRQPDSEIARRLLATDPDEIALCAVVKAELLYGAHRSLHRDDNLKLLEELFSQFVSLPLDDYAAEAYGRIRAQLAAAGAVIGPNDLKIAAIALAHNLALVTHNTREFSRVEGLQLEDWEMPA
jgi:tRNA(fMet)-specific endonuclease VapC